MIEHRRDRPEHRAGHQKESAEYDQLNEKQRAQVIVRRRRMALDDLPDALACHQKHRRAEYRAQRHHEMGVFEKIGPPPRRQRFTRGGEMKKDAEEKAFAQENRDQRRDAPPEPLIPADCFTHDLQAGFDLDSAINATVPSSTIASPARPDELISGTDMPGLLRLVAVPAWALAAEPATAAAKTAENKNPLPPALRTIDETSFITPP
jgi:hypothetical protein